MNLKKKLTDHNHDKYITTPEFNTLAADVFNARLAQANLITKTDFDAKLSSLNRKITSNKSKHLLENELKRLKTFDSSYFIGKSHFEDNNTQNYLVFQQMHRYFNQISGVGSDNHIYSSKTKALSNENIGATATKDYKLNPELSFFGTKTKVEFNRSCLKQDKITYNHGKVVNIYIVYEISKSINISEYPTLENGLEHTLQGLEHTLSTGKMYFINFAEHNKNFGLSLHYNGAKSYLLVDGK